MIYLSLVLLVGVGVGFYIWFRTFQTLREFKRDGMSVLESVDDLCQEIERGLRLKRLVAEDTRKKMEDNYNVLKEQRDKVAARRAEQLKEQKLNQSCVSVNY